eukprot:Phypoly_transcript_09142.p1 GENE.Phypoly_transcript_09142~~Phypoly_transcript_09142.p1  ORF type:complete len:436 (+),score=43.47 Phypoly_transcript_09142:43-1350(+)
MRKPTGILLFSVLASLFSSFYAQVNWSTLTSEQLSQLPPSAFSNITSEQLGSIPSASCSGFQSGQVAAISPSGFAGWKSACVSFLSSTAWNQTSSAQIAQLTSNATAGLRPSVVSNIPPSASSGWTSVGLQGLSTDPFYYDGCGGFSWPQFAVIPLDAYPGWQASCIYALNANIFTNISATQMNAIPTGAYAGFLPNQIDNLQNEVLLSITLSNFAYLEEGIDGLYAPKLAILIQKYGTNFTNLLTNLQLRFYGNNIDNIIKFKSMIPNTVAPLYQILPQNTTWLQLSLAIDLLIDSKVIQSNGFSSTTVWGVTAAQAPLVTIDALQNFAMCCAKYILPDTINGFTCTQIPYLASAYSGLTLEARAAYTSRKESCPTNQTTSSTSNSGFPSTTTSGSTTATSTGSSLLSLREFGITTIATVLSFGVFIWNHPLWS